MASQSRQIKAALKKEFPNTKFSVTTHYGDYTVKWDSNIIDGVTLENVKAIADEWHTLHNASLDSYSYSDYRGETVYYEMNITLEGWQEYVINLIDSMWGDCSYSEVWKAFKTNEGQRHHHANETLSDWLYNGVKMDLESDESNWDREYYYKQQSKAEVKTEVVTLAVETEEESTEPKHTDLYKFWINELVKADRFTEIVSYEIWEQENLESMISDRYKSFINVCVESGRHEDILSLQDWRNRHYPA